MSLRMVGPAPAVYPANRARPAAAARHAARIPPRTFAPPRSLRVRRAGPSLLFRGAAGRVPGLRSLRVWLGRRGGPRRGHGHREASGHRGHRDSRRRGAGVRGAAPGAALFRRRHRREAPTVIPRRTLADREDVLGVAMLAPALAYVVLLVGVPFGLAILLSFSNATAGSLSFGWVGGRNYAAILSDPLFLRSLRNTAIVTIRSPALLVALPP